VLLTGVESSLAAFFVDSAVSVMAASVAPLRNIPHRIRINRDRRPESFIRSQSIDVAIPALLLAYLGL
jgi:hypothetical protein